MNIWNFSNGLKTVVITRKNCIHLQKDGIHEFCEDYKFKKGEYKYNCDTCLNYRITPMLKSNERIFE